MLVEIYSILGSSASIISMIITIKQNNKHDISRTIIKYFIFIIALLLFVYYHNNERFSKLQNDNLINDARISGEIEKQYTSTYSGHLAKLSIIVGFYERHKNLYKEEYERFKEFYKQFDEKYRKSDFYNSDIDEIEQVVEIGISNIKEILKQNNSTLQKSKMKFGPIINYIINFLFIIIILIFLKEIYVYLKKI